MSTTQTDAILANVFLSVRDRLAAIPDLQFIGMDTGQLEWGEENASPILFPCVLLGHININYTDNKKSIQQGDAELELLLAMATPGPGQSSEVESTVTDYFNLEHKINQALHGWCDQQYFNPMSRIRAKNKRRKRTDVRIRALRFGFGFVDDTAMQVGQTGPRPEMAIAMR
ncbi:hypothetical protein SNE26_20405 [Mucilaginibacter sp. cycad4]|uniref:hypothetical protein n=1 Tax=Mucilaginibacter sp. cycad4 TaxID=3342096 RepID=UPI002AAB4DEF|nr:hypothetical protein [Mucilaginibacter gossypii]WPU98391.1 hypothetical protein SNE26_20405 [Mucilaginibacter gossypii]